MRKRDLRQVFAVVVTIFMLGTIGYMVFTSDWRDFLTWLWGVLAMGPFCVRTFRPDLLSPLEAGFIAYCGGLLMWFDLAGPYATASPLLSLLFGGMFVLLVGTGVYMLRNNILIS